MNRVVFLLEERSMKVLLEGLLPRLVPDMPFLCVTHEGKGDLEKSIPRKLRAWREPGVRFVVVRDNDGADCLELKRGLADLCRQAGRVDTLIRIPCQELEAWYFGDPEALAQAYGSARPRSFAGSSRYRVPDAIRKPSTDLERLLPGFQKISGARKMGALLAEERNRSRSFQVFVAGVRRVASELAAGSPESKGE
jgi:hypothetical protein